STPSERRRVSTSPAVSGATETLCSSAIKPIRPSESSCWQPAPLQLSPAGTPERPMHTALVLHSPARLECGAMARPYTSVTSSIVPSASSHHSRHRRSLRFHQRQGRKARSYRSLLRVLTLLLVQPRLPQAEQV